MMSWIVELPVWQMLRILGFLSYLMIAAGICIAIVYSLPFWRPVTKKKLFKLHPLMTNSGIAIGMLHGCLLVIDTYSPFTWREVLVPFTAAYAPVLAGLGTLSVYGLLLITFTTDIRSKLNRKLWRYIHLIAYPIFVMTSIHGIYLGTDSGLLIGKWIYVAAIGAVLFATIIRIIVPAAARPLKTTARTGVYSK